MNNIGLGLIYKDRSSDVAHWLQLFFGLSFLPVNEVVDAFTDNIMPDASASDTVMKFADYVLENYIVVDSNFPPTLWVSANLVGYAHKVGGRRQGCTKFITAQ